MRINVTLLITITLSIVIAGVILAWLLLPRPKLETQLVEPPAKLPIGPVGFKMLPACALPERT
jgi:hypothetical protein